ncbi:MAG TPA: A24 family peptidase, partial [Rhizomicrobium sp.]|nr:A24 family peptidase [Rhizomicrobium sp.]
YAAVELLAAVLFVGVYARFGLTLEALKYCVFGFLLLGLIFTDAETKLLPDEMTLSGLGLGLVFSLFVPVNDLMARLLPGVINLPVSSDISWHLISLADAALGAIVGASFIYGAGKLYQGVRGVEGMGFGDVKLMAMIGAFLGLKLTVFTLFAASVLGSLFGVGTVLVVWLKRTRRWRQRRPAVARQRAWQSAKLVYRRYEMPFGVFLGAVAMFAFFFGNRVLGWYWGRFS